MDFFAAKEAGDYESIIAASFSLRPEDTGSAREAHAIGKAFEKKNAFEQSIPWYIRSFTLDPSDEALGMIAGVCLAFGQLDRLREIMAMPQADSSGFYYNAALYELSARLGEPDEKQIEMLEKAIDIQYEQSYMLRLSQMYVESGREKDAGRMCKKVMRLFPDTGSSAYAKDFLAAVKEGRASEFIGSSPWTENMVFKHLSFDKNAPVPKNVTIPSPAAEPAKMIAAAQPERSAEKTAAPADTAAKAAAPAAAGSPKQSVLDKTKSAIGGLFGSGRKDEDAVQKAAAEKKKKKPEEKFSPIAEKAAEGIVGMKELKRAITSLANILQTEKRRVGVEAVTKNNIVIVGPDGSGKTTAAGVLAKAYCLLGITSSETPVFTDYDSLVSDKDEEIHDNIEKLFTDAENSCIVIENIHEFDDGSAFPIGLRIIDQIVKAYSAAEGVIPIVITGREKETTTLLEKKRRFRELFDLPNVYIGDYSAEELMQITDLLADKQSLVITEDAKAMLSKKIKNLAEQPDFAYSHDLSAIVSNAYQNMANRLGGKRRKDRRDGWEITADDIDAAGDAETIEVLLEQLNSMTGLDSVKEQVRKMVNIQKAKKKRAEMGIEDSGGGTLHLIFTGNPGTGKTTVARIIGKIYRRLGVLPKGQLIECVRKDLIETFVGGTAKKVEAKVKEAMGGILFIDEAYDLVQGDHDAYGKEAVNTLLTEMENRRDGFMVILAGYTNEMNKLLDTNPGLRSRIPKVLNFEDYTVEEMVSIFKQTVRGRNLMLDAGLDDDIYKLISKRSSMKDFGNARGVRNIADEIKTRLDDRVTNEEAEGKVVTRNDYIIIRKQDIPSDGDNVLQSAEALLEKLESMTGLGEVKKQVKRLVNQVKARQMRAELGIEDDSGNSSLHMLFTGNAGTGKTTVARIIGKIYHELGVLPSGQLVECLRKDLVANYVGGTAKLVHEKVEEAYGGILFIDEAYELIHGDGDSYGKEAVNTLLAEMENRRDKLMVILAGYGPEMEQFLDTNQGLRSRIPTTIVFEDYSPDELVQIFKDMVRSRKRLLDSGLDDDIRTLLSERASQKDFGNARGVRNVLDEVLKRLDTRIIDETSAGKQLTKEDVITIRRDDLGISGKNAAAGEKHKTYQDYIDDLNRLTGLAAVKKQVGTMVNSVIVNKQMKEHGLKTQGFGTLHMVFKGNAGTGKTTVARIIGNIYRELGVLSSGHLVECDRSKLVAGYVGQTASKTKAKVEEALGGVLFIDEAYSLMQGSENDYGQEAITELVADIENYRSDLCVIIAGYSKDMDIFLNANQGLRSRFPNEILFEDYSQEELMSIFEGMIASNGLVLGEEARALVPELILRRSSGADFGNARGVRNIVDMLLRERNTRLAAGMSAVMSTGSEEKIKEYLTLITAEDIGALLS